MAVAIRRGEWRRAKIYIRRIRAMLRRHPTEYEIQRLQGSVVINEGLVERATGNFTRHVVGGPQGRFPVVNGIVSTMPGSFHINLESMPVESFLNCLGGILLCRDIW